MDHDIVLVVGGNAQHIPAHSLLLRLASKVFNALLGPHFSEGQNIGSGSDPKEIPLPDDDEVAAAIVVDVLHHRQPTGIDLDASVLLRVAVFTDKYDCTTALSYASYQWLQRVVRSETEDLAKFLTAAYLLRDREAFRQISKTLIYSFGGSFVDLSSDVAEMTQFMPASTSCAYGMPKTIQKLKLTHAGLLEELRNRVRMQTVEAIFNPTVFAFTCPCKYQERYMSSYVKILWKKRIWPSATMTEPLKDITERFNMMRWPPLPESIPCSETQRHPTFDIQGTVVPNFVQLHTQTYICLDCLRTEPGRGAIHCKLDHSRHES